MLKTNVRTQKDWMDSMVRGGCDQLIGGLLKAVGRALAFARQDAGLTQEEAVERLYPKLRSVQTISTWENGWHKATPELFERLCVLYGVTPESVLKEAYHSLWKSSGEGRAVFLQGDEQELLRLYRRCTCQRHRDIAAAVLNLGLEDGKEAGLAEGEA